MPNPYTDLRLRLLPLKAAEGYYPVEAELSDGSRFDKGQLKLDHEQLLAQELDPQGFGEALFNTLFPAGGEARRAHDTAVGLASAQSGGRLRVRLWVDDEAVELHAIPWERLYHPVGERSVSLTASALTPFSRYTSLEIREPDPVTETPIKMLVAVSNPTGLPGDLKPANVDEEVETLCRALSELKTQGKVEVTILPGRTGLSPDLQKRLEQEGYVIVKGNTNLFTVAPLLDKCHIFHFIGHGAFRPAPSPIGGTSPMGEGRGGGTAALYLEKKDGAWQPVKDEEIESMLTALGTLPHLIFLVACESAKREANATSPFVGLGPKLVRAGVPAVVAMQDRVPVELARTLSAEFYSRLAEHGEVDRALNQARLQVFNAKSIEWAIPVLFMRIRNGRLFGAEPEAGDEAPAPGEPPYKGLQYFSEKDADKFYGREVLIAKLVGKLRQSRFLPVIIGASGSGKSSIVRAGVIPALKRGTPLADGTLPPEGSATWVQRLIVPSAQPLESLAAALTQDAGSVSAMASLIDDLRKDERSLHLAARQALSRVNGSRLLLMVDQFEEIFTLCKNEADRKAFIDNLLYAAAPTTDGPTIVIIVFRADFYAHCGQYDNLREAVSTNQEYVGPMNRDELRRSIEEPAKAGGWEIEPGLTDSILNEVVGEPGALPLMQHALLETWNRRRGRAMTLRGYAEAGGIRGAIAKTAEAVYTALPEIEQPIARRIFLRLVELGEGTQDTRRRARLEELYPRPEEKPLIEGVLNKLTANRLIVANDKTAEVAHEALIREWPTLRKWLDESRDALRLQRELLDAVEDWERVGKDEGALYRGVQLAQAVEWAAAHADELSPLEKEFLATSQAVAEREAREKEERRQRELEAAHRAAEAAQKLAETQRQQAEERAQQARVSLAGKLASTAMALPATQLDRALLLSVEASRLHHDSNTLGSLLATLEKTQKLERILHGHSDTVTALAFRPGDQPLLASGAANGEVFLWDLSAEPPALKKLDGHDSIVLSLAFSADGTKLASTDWEQSTVIVWDTASGKKLAEAELEDFAECLAFAPDGSRLLVGQNNGVIADLDPETLALRGSLEAHAVNITSLAFNEKGTEFASGDAEGVIKLWSAKTLKQKGNDMQTDGEVLALAYDPGGEFILIGTSERTIEVWALKEQAFYTRSSLEPLGRIRCAQFVRPNEVLYASSANDFTRWNYAELHSGDENSGLLRLPLRGLEGAVDAAALNADGSRLASSAGQAIYLWRGAGAMPLAVTMQTERIIRAVAISPDGQTLATGSESGELQFWNTETLQQMGETLTDKDNISINDLAFSPDNQRLAGVWDDGRVSLMDSATGQMNVIQGHAQAAHKIAFSLDGRWLATTGESDGVHVWAADSLNEIYHLAEVTATDAAFSPDGKVLAIGTRAAAIELRDSATGELLGEPIRGHTNVVWSVVFSPAGQRLASASRDFTIRLWDVATRTTVGTLVGSTDEVRSIAFSPDGRWLISTGDEGTVRVWDMLTFQLVGVPLHHHFDEDGYGEGYRLAFAPNGQWFASCGTLPYTLNLRTLNVEQLRQRALGIAGRELTKEEWALHMPDLA